MRRSRWASAHRCSDLTPTTSLSDVVREKDRLDETLIRQLAMPHSSGLHLLAAPADAVEAADIDDEVLSRILTLARHTYDFVLVDTFPMLDRAMVAVLDLSDRAYVVLENVVPTLLGAVKMVEVLRGLGLSNERQRIVLNRYTTLPGSVKPADRRQPAWPCCRSRHSLRQAHRGCRQHGRTLCVAGQAGCSAAAAICAGWSMTSTP